MPCRSRSPLDDSPRLRDARGMVGQRLHIAVHLVRVAGAALLQSPGGDRALPSRCRRGGRGPYAAGLACLSEDEATFGAVVLDLGAGVTGIARFADRPSARSWRACRSARST